MLTTLRFHLAPVRMTIFKNTINNKHWRGRGETGTLITVDRNVSQYNHYGKQYGGSLKK
jgi:hypothetical protein